MTVVLPWLRRVRRSTRVCLASAALLVIWSLPEVAAPLLAPVFAALVLLILAGLFVWWYWIRPRRFRRRRGPADVRLRPLSPRTLRPLAAGIGVACIACQAAYLLHLRFLPVPDVDPFQDFFAMGQQPWGWLVIFVMAVVLAPVIEETVFRGWIQRPLERLWGPAPAVIVSATLFALVHGIPEYLPFYFAIGVLLGGVVLLTRSLWASVLLHAAFNLQNLALALVGPGDLLSELLIARQTPVVILSAAVLISCSVFLVSNARRVRATVRPARAVPVGPAVRVGAQSVEVGA
jgi:membrane protease YdiL (CAAX protease family)